MPPRRGHTPSFSEDNPLAGFDAYISDPLRLYTAERAGQIALLHTQVHQILPTTEDRQAVNQLLEKAGRPDLTIDRRAYMDPIPSPRQMHDVKVAESFPSSLRLPAHRDGTPADNLDIRQIAAGVYRCDDTMMGGPFTVVKRGEDYVTMPKPVLARFIIVAGAMAEDVITRSSHPRTQDVDKRLEEIYAAYAVQRNLVDEADPYVTVTREVRGKQQLVVDSGYLKR